MPEYYAITTTNPKSGWYVVAHGSNKNKVRQAAENKIGPVATDYGTDIYKQTEHTNLKVVSKSTAERKYGMGSKDAETVYNRLRNAIHVK